MKLTKEQIEFLDDVCTGKWILNEDGEVDVDSSVNMIEMQLTEIPVKFGRVEGHFDCSHNNLTTLKNCPDFVGGCFYFYDNNLTDYFKSIKEEDFPHWDKLSGVILSEYPFLINIGKKYMIDLKYILNIAPQTKLYYKD